MSKLILSAVALAEEAKEITAKAKEQVLSTTSKKIDGRTWSLHSLTTVMGTAAAGVPRTG